MSLICSTLTWYLGKEPLAERLETKLVHKEKRSDDDFLSMFGGLSESEDTY